MYSTGRIVTLAMLAVPGSGADVSHAQCATKPGWLTEWDYIEDTYFPARLKSALTMEVPAEIQT